MGIFNKLFGGVPIMSTPRTVTYYDPPEQYIPQIVESLELTKKTLNPRTFFYRYQFASDRAVHIMEVKKVIYEGKTPAQIYKWLNNKNTKNMLQREFVDRLFDAHRENSIIYQMEDVRYRMTRETKDYYLGRLAGRKFHFCKVKFDVNDKKMYTYVTKDKNLAEGDMVTVNTGDSTYPKMKLVQVLEVFDDCVENLPFELEKLRCVEGKLKGIECPHCGASIQVDVGQKTGQCEYCGTEFYLLK